MIRIEPDTSAPPLFTNAQFLTAARIIAENPHLHYDLTEERFNQDSVTWSRLMLWAWPNDRDQVPVRWWIEPDGKISLAEDADWITPDEWPAWAGTPDTKGTQP